MVCIRPVISCPAPVHQEEHELQLVKRRDTSEAAVLGKAIMKWWFKFETLQCCQKSDDSWSVVDASWTQTLGGRPLKAKRNNVGRNFKWFLSCKVIDFVGCRISTLEKVTSKRGMRILELDVPNLPAWSTHEYYLQVLLHTGIPLYICILYFYIINKSSLCISLWLDSEVKDPLKGPRRIRVSASGCVVLDAGAIPETQEPPASRTQPQAQEIFRYIVSLWSFDCFFCRVYVVYLSRKGICCFVSALQKFRLLSDYCILRAEAWSCDIQQGWRTIAMPQRDSRPVQVLTAFENWVGAEIFVFGTSIPTLAEMLHFHSFNIAIVNSSWNPFRISCEKIEWQGIGEDLVHLQIYSLRVLQIQCQAQRHGMGWSSHQASKTKGHWACEMRWI